MMRFRNCIFLISYLWILVYAGDEEVPKNEVVGEPVVSCAADAIYVKFRTKSTFLGHVDVKYTPDKSCFQSLVTNNQIEVLIPHEECMIERRRSIHPKGVILEVALAVSFHPEFTTIDDRIFNLLCFHQRNGNGSIQESTNQNDLAVGFPTLPPTSNNDSQGPSCDYRIESFPGGPPVNLLTLGQNVIHTWNCQNIYESCIFVENCELIGGDQKHLIIDTNGCSRSKDIMPQIQYHNKTSASVGVKVFGVSHTPIVYFSCQIRLHPQSPSGNCPTPDCGDDIVPSSREKRTVDTSPSIDVRSQNLEISQLLIGNLPSSEEKSCYEDSKVSPTTPDDVITETASQNDRHICADFRSVLVVSIILTLGCVTMTTLIVFLVIRRHKYEIASMT